MACEDTGNEALGELVAKWRKGAALSQNALAEALGTQQATISKLENGACRLTVLQLGCILSACGLSFMDVADELEQTLNADAKPIWERIDE